jgi:protein-S-isoprenylcysteine O-methyltransferase Ste14
LNLDDLYRLGLVVMAGWTILTVALLLRLVAPYGRHGRGGWGPTMPARWAWILFESPAVVLLTAVFLVGPNAGAPGPTALIALWLLHYVHRDLVWPFRMTSGHKPMPLAVVAAAFAFQIVNSGLIALWLGHLGTYPATWLSDPRFIIGAALFLAGFAINVHADHVLFTLRAPGETGYKIPRGGLYRWVSCPNYLGELLAWSGFALASWCLPGLAFAVYTAANLVPRAVAHHRWYRERFPDYPADRRALIPGLL